MKRQSIHEPVNDTPAEPNTASITENASHTVLADDASAPAGDADAAHQWKAEYDAQVEGFKARSAEQREKAERERERWEKVRSEQGGPPLGPIPGPLAPKVTSTSEEGHLTGLGTWESVQGATGSGEPAPARRDAASPADGRDYIPGEGLGPPATHGSRETGATASEHSGSGENSGSDIPSSLTSSFPSSAFDIDTPPLPSPGGTFRRPERGRHHLADTRGHPSKAPIPAPAPFAGAAHAEATRAGEGEEKASMGVTPMIFDSSLAPRTRALALLASLGINLLLPFINGIMLGVGEIFAKEIIGSWWNAPGGIAAQLGLRKETRRR